MAGVTLHPLHWVVAILLITTTYVSCAPYLNTAPAPEGSQQPPLDHLFSPDQGLIGPLFRQNDYSIDPPTMGGCYYQFRPYDEGDRIITNEPCLNCTCHNSMLMCYLKVCPFSKPIGQDCTIEKDPNQCCPVITCPQVPVGLEVLYETALTTTKSPASTAVVPYTKHGCTIADEFYPDGAQVPGDPRNPCELCYCIRNHTACLMQECILKVEGCKPVFEDGICCPVRYMCEYDDEELLQITTTFSPVNETIITTLPPHIGGCTHNSEFYADGAQIPSEDPCEHCYCMKNDIVCAIQECRSPLDEDDENCVPRLPLPGKCCPEAYDCPTTDETTITATESTTDAYSPFGIEPVVGTEKPEDKEFVEETTLKYVTAEIVTVTKRPEDLITTENVTTPEGVKVTDITELVTSVEETTSMPTQTPEVADKEIDKEPAEITKSTDSDSDLFETRTTGPDDEMFLTTTPMSDETTFEPVTKPTTPAVKPEEKIPEPTLKPGVISETDIEFDIEATPEPKEPVTEIPLKPEEIETVTEEVIPKDTTLSPIDSIETTSAKEEEIIEVLLETTPSEKIEPVDVTTEAIISMETTSIKEEEIIEDLLETTPSGMIEPVDEVTAKVPTVSEEITTEEIEEITDAPKQEVVTEAATPDKKPETFETTLSSEELLETTSPKEEIMEISKEITTTEKSVDITSEVTISPDVVVTDAVEVATVSEIDAVETTTTLAVEPVTGHIDPKIQPTITQPPVVAPVDGKCLSNGTMYDEGDLVPIINVCQENCICTSGTVTCQQIACPSPPPAFLRCDTQKNPKECCPQYECPMIQPDPVPSPNCISNGQQYLEGEFIPSPDSCTDCYCLYGEIICAYQECPEVEPGCKPLEIPEGACCPAKYECPAMEILDLTLTTVPSAEVDEVVGTTYQPKELPEIDITSTETAEVTELDVATTPSTITDDLITEKPAVEISTTTPDVTKYIVEITTEMVSEEKITEAQTEVTFTPDVIEVEPETTITPEDLKVVTIEEEIDMKTTPSLPVEIVELSTTAPSIEPITIEVVEEVTLMPDVTTKSTLETIDEIETTPAEPLVEETSVKPAEVEEEMQEDPEETATDVKPTDTIEPVTTQVYETTKKDEAVTTESPIEATTLIYDTDKTTSEMPAETDLLEEIAEPTTPYVVEDISDTTLMATTTSKLPDKDIEVAVTTEIPEETTELPAKATTIYEELIEPVTTPTSVKVPIEIELATGEPDIEITTIMTDIETPIKEIIQPDDGKTETSIPVISTETPAEYSPSTDATESIDESTTLISVEMKEPVTSIDTEDADEATVKPAIPTPETLTSIIPEVETTVVVVSETTKVVETTTDEIITDYLPPSSKKPEIETVTTMLPVFEGCWWFDNNLYEHGDAVPSENTCQENCTCTNGTVRCQHKACPPAPPSFLRCTETSSNDSCCPTFECAPSPTELKCEHNGQVFDDNEYVPSDTICQDCFCLSGEVVCAELVCGVPRMNCEATVQKENECCPSVYECLETITPDLTTTLLPEEELKATDIIGVDEVLITTPSVDISDKTTVVSQVVTEIEATTVQPEIMLDIEDDQPDAEIEDQTKVTTISPFIVEKVTTEEIAFPDIETTSLPDITIDITTPKEVIATELEITTSEKLEPVALTTEPAVYLETTSVKEDLLETTSEKLELIDETPEPKEPATESPLKPEEIETVTEEVIPKDTTLSPIDSIETTSAKEEEIIEALLETTTSEKIEPVDATTEAVISMETTSIKEEEIIVDLLETTISGIIEPVDEVTAKVPTVLEEITTDEIVEITDAPIKEVVTEAVTTDTKPEIFETTLSSEVLLETTTPKEEIMEISKEITTTEKLVDVSSEVTVSPVEVVTDDVEAITVSEIDIDLVETTTTQAVDPVTGHIDPKIQPTITQKPVVTPVDGKCLSNETIYDEGDLVPIVNACQENCICTSGTVTCQQIACPSPPPAFLRCDAQKNPKECCPQYECPMIQPDPVPSPNCISNGQQYLEGEFIPSPDSCTDCYCLYGEIICAYQECPEVESGCKPLEIPEGACCPTKYECPAMEILDLTLTTTPSVEVEEVVATTYPPKELPEIEITSTETSVVTELDVATTDKPAVEISPLTTLSSVEVDEVAATTYPPKELSEMEITSIGPTVVAELDVSTKIPDELITEKPEVEISTIIHDVTKEIEVVTPEAVTEEAITEVPAEVTFAPEVVEVEPVTTTTVDTETPDSDVELTTALPEKLPVETTSAVGDGEVTTSLPFEKLSTQKIPEEPITSEVKTEIDVTTVLSVDIAEVTAVEEIELTTLPPPKELTSPDIEDESTVAPEADTMPTISTPLEPASTETTVKPAETATEPSLTSTDGIQEDEEDIKMTTDSGPEEIITDAVTVSMLETTMKDELTTIEPSIDYTSADNETEKAATEYPTTAVIPEEITETTVPSKVVDVADDLTTTELPLLPVIIEETTKLDTETTTMSEKIFETTSTPKFDIVVDAEVTTAIIPETDMQDLTTVSKVPEEDVTEAIEQTEGTTIDSLTDVQTDKIIEAATDIPLDLTITTEGEAIAVEELTTLSPEVDRETVVNITTTETPVEIITTPTSEVQTEKSTDLLVEMTTTSHVSPDIEVTTSAVDTDTTIIPYFEGCWWFDDKLYEHGESVPSDNSCQENCRCINGTVRCQYKACPPTPPTFLHCAETFNNDSCCTNYECAPLPTNLQCMHQGKIYADGDYIPSETLCFDCYCVEGEVICADLVCGIPRNDCDAIMQRADECCPTTYECKEMVSPDLFATTPAADIELSPTTTAKEDLIEPKIKNITSAESVEITPSPEVVTEGIEADEETLPEMPEKVPEVGTDVQYIPPTTVAPNETTTWTPSTTTELVIGPGSCLFNGKVYVSAQQIPRDDPCDFCFCFRGDIICLQQTCPPPIPGCYEEAISGFCCPRYECPVKQSVIEITTTTTPFPSFPPLYKTSRETVCEVDGLHYPVGQVIPEASSPCHECICGKDGFMKCLPKECDSHRKLTIHGYR